MDPATLMSILPFLTGKSNQGSFLSQNAGTMGLGLLQTVPSLINLIKMSRQERPNYTVGPEQQRAYNLAQRRSQFGFMPQQIGAFNQNLAAAQNTDFYNARNMAGGGLAQALSGAMTGRRLGSLNQFAAQDAQENRQSVRDLFGETRGIVSQQNLGKREDIGDYDRKMTALGRSLSSGLTNTASAINANQALGLGFGKLDYRNTLPLVDEIQPKKIALPETGQQPLLLKPMSIPFGGYSWNPYKGGFVPDKTPYAPESMLSTEF
jgi:hypothetical protein